MMGLVEKLLDGGYFNWKFHADQDASEPKMVSYLSSITSVKAKWTEIGRNEVGNSVRMD